ncbi:hypothetical protein EHF36_01935 [Kerstersia gyiorum]|uniref:hypothetical protein n=1 Tax=Kerstersia gyiorum TaxID=206506 RepID=UPI0010715814|nr:hypothetical protein [Kerstersia gyiorum]QBR39533.1 hypothetical protein EHF36_01935 [Kerstersia gyiorum]
MQIKPRLYPHPVLAWFSDDYCAAMFQPAFEVSGNKGFYKIRMTCRTSSRSINRLIEEKKAAYAVHIECPATRYRALFSSPDQSFEIDIPVADIDGKVEVCRLIVASKEISNYASDEFHPDFTGRSFNLLRGDVLAVAEDITFYADKKSDELAKLPSIFSIRRSPDNSAAPMDVDLTGDRIVVHLSPATYEKFTSLNSDELVRSTLSSALLVPALVLALEKVMRPEDREGLMDLRWCRTVIKKLKDIGIDAESLSESGENSLVLSNKLIGDPLSAALEDLTQILLRAED